MLSTETISEKLMKHLNLFVSQTCSSARKLYVDRGTVSPMVIFLTIKADDENKKLKKMISLCPCSDFFRNPEVKEQFAKQILPQAAKMVSPLAYALVAEAWAVKVAGGKEKWDEAIKNYTPASENPDRIECLTISFFTYGKKATAMYEIMRPDPDGKPILMEASKDGCKWMPVEKDDPSRFNCDILKQSNDMYSMMMNKDYDISPN